LQRLPCPEWQDYQDTYLHILEKTPLNLMDQGLTELFESNGKYAMARLFMGFHHIRDMDWAFTREDPRNWIIHLFCHFLQEAPCISSTVNQIQT